MTPASLRAADLFEYRFSAGAEWRRLDRVLVLDAFPGERRVYRLFLKHPAYGESSLEYVVDRRPPEPPALSPPSGDVGPSLAIRAASSDTVMISVDGGPFQRLDPSSPPGAGAFPDSTRIVWAAAYAVDALGNASQIVHGAWRLVPAGVSPSHSFADELGTLSAGAVFAAPAGSVSASARHDPREGLTVSLALPSGSSPLVSVDASDAAASLESFADLGVSATGAASVLIPVPWGFQGKFRIAYGYRNALGVFLAREQLQVSTAFPAESSVEAPPLPPRPQVAAIPGLSVVSWQATPWKIFVAAGDDAYRQYTGPIAFDDASRPAALSYYAESADGSRSAIVGLEIRVAPRPAPPAVLGAEDGASYGKPVRLTPASPGTVRFQYAEGAAVPAPVGPASERLESGASFSGQAGKIVAYTVRLVSFDADGRPGPERIIRFSIDREPPPVPAVLGSPSRFASDDASLEFRPNEGAIYVSVSEDGNGPFVPYVSSISLPGDDLGRKRYVVRAWAEDRFGNRSAEMPRMELLVDRTAVYADPRGRAGASGFPDDPVASLDEALAIAGRTGRNRVNVRGALTAAAPVVLGGGLTLAGGFDAAWNDDASARASVRWTAPVRDGAPALRTEGFPLSVIGLDLLATLEGNAVFMLARGGGLTLERSRIELSGGLDATAIKAQSSSVSMRDVDLSARDAFTARGLDLSDCSAELRDVEFLCAATVRLFEAIRVVGGMAEIKAIRVDARPTQAFSGLNAVSARVISEGCAFFIAGGSSSCRVYSADAAILFVSSVYIDADWKGELTAFRAISGSDLRVGNATAYLSGTGVTGVDASGSSWQLANSIVNMKAAKTLLARSSTVPAAGSVSANCLWGIASFIEGAVSTASIAGLNAFAVPDYQNFAEKPESTFVGLVKGIRRLSPSSACVDGGMGLSWAASFDMDGEPKPSGSGSRRPDIGADEL